MNNQIFKLNLFIILVIVCLFFGADFVKAEEQVAIHLVIQTHDAVLYNQDMVVTACDSGLSSASSTINAKCAIEQSGLENDWTWWGEDAFLDSIDGYQNDYVNGFYWQWFNNLEYGQIALNRHELTVDENLLLTYNINPLRISTSTTTPAINVTSTILVEQFGLDESWNPVWLTAAGGTLVINDEEFENLTGSYEFTASTSTLYYIYGKKDGYVNTEVIEVNPVEAIVEEEEDETNNTGSSSSGGTVFIPPVIHQKIDVNKAIEFLASKQNDDGSFGSAIYTDWAAIALGSFNVNHLTSQKIKNYLLTDPDPLAGMNSVSDYARRAMAMMSLNINPYQGTETNYIEKITDSFDGNQFGDSSLYNDDIFALLVLLNAGYDYNDEIIKNTVNFLMSNQTENGSWGGVDLTAATIQSLSSLQAESLIFSALQRARNFLYDSQKIDGGFGNSFSTAWSLQAITALSEDENNWQKNNLTPNDYLASKQGQDGGLEKDSDYEINRIWATSYAIPAALGKDWHSLLGNFVKEEESTELFANNNLGDLEDTATTTIHDFQETATSTAELKTASSTLITDNKLFDTVNDKKNIKSENTVKIEENVEFLNNKKDNKSAIKTDREIILPQKQITNSFKNNTTDIEGIKSVHDSTSTPKIQGASEEKIPSSSHNQSKISKILLKFFVAILKFISNLF